MQDWGFLFMVLDKVQSKSTVIGKIWIRALFIFRILILGAAAIVWEDERSSLVCNAQTPGCENVCYDQQFPISQIRFWIVQVIFVSMPTILYLCHVIHVIHQKDKLRERVRQQHDSQVTNIPNYPDDEGRVEIKSNLFISYLTHLFFKIILELAFIIAQCYLYDFFMRRSFNCASRPCPFSVECYMSRPTEKSIFNVLMLAVACVSLMLNVIEAVYLMCSRARCCSGSKTENPTSVSICWNNELGDEVSINQIK